jgi:hypothetical protein
MAKLSLQFFVRQNSKFHKCLITFLDPLKQLTYVRLSKIFSQKVNSTLKFLTWGNDREGKVAGLNRLDRQINCWGSLPFIEFGDIARLDFISSQNTTSPTLFKNNFDIVRTHCEEWSLGASAANQCGQSVWVEHSWNRVFETANLWVSIAITSVLLFLSLGVTQC